jgi:hypothetical protein
MNRSLMKGSRVICSTVEGCPWCSARGKIERLKQLMSCKADAKTGDLGPVSGWPAVCVTSETKFDDGSLTHSLPPSSLVTQLILHPGVHILLSFIFICNII